MNVDLPTLFVSHGAPPLALEDNAVTRTFGELGRSLAPRAIVAVSAHWDTAGPAVTTINAAGKPCILANCTVGTGPRCAAVYFPTGSGTAGERLEGFHVQGGAGLNQTCGGG